MGATQQAIAQTLDHTSPQSRPQRSAEDALAMMIKDCWAVRRDEPHRCLLLAERAMPIAQELRDVHAQAQLLLACANARAIWRQFNQAEELCQEAHYLAVALEADLLEGWRLAISAEIQFKSGREELGAVSLDQARRTFQAANDTQSIAELNTIYPAPSGTEC